jgi:C4-dicarboxylate-specific signal transduction histidine kinase
LTIVPRRPNPRLERWLRESRPPAEVVKLVVACSGHGIPGDIDKQLYDPSHPGGLGLAIARRIVEQARGALWIQRAREGGTSFHIVLPFAAPSLLPDHEADDARLLAAS